MTNRRQADAEFMAELTAELGIEAPRGEVDAEERPLVDALLAVGLDIKSPWFSEPWNEYYPAAVPVLLDHFARPYSPWIRDEIARLLATPDARPIWHTLKDLYLAEDSDEVKLGLAWSLAQTSSDDTIDEVIELLLDPLNGESRGFLLGVARFPTRAIPAIESLADDPDLGQMVPQVLRSLRNRARAKAGGPPET